MSTKLTLTFATKYNGVCINLTDLKADTTDDMDTVFDEVGDTLPEFTGDWADNWDHELSDEHIKKLCEKAEKIVHPIIPDADISFEYDHYSS